MFNRKYRKQMHALAEELERAASAFDLKAYMEISVKIRKLHGVMYRGYGPFYRELSWWIMLLSLLFLLASILYFIFC